MSFNLIETVVSALAGGGLADKLGAAIGASGSATTSALQSAVPAILGGLLNRGSTPSGAGELFDVLSRGNHDGLLGNLGSLLGGGDATGNLLKTGAALLPAIFGNRLGPIADLIGARSGVSAGASKSLLGALAPLVLGFIAKQLRGGGGFNVSGLTNLLMGQREHLQRAAVPGLASALGVSDFGVAPAAPATGGSGGLMKWLIPLIAIVGGFLLLRSCQRDEAPAPAPAVETMPAPAAAPAPVSDLLERMLPDSNKIMVKSDGVEDRLIAFLSDGTRAVDKTTWFTFDRLEFETGSATLKPSSAAQLDNIAAILRAWPAAALKLGGYTDNTGNPEVNKALSQSRAESAVAALVERGIDAARLGAEGYGDQFPIADNATEEGRQRNRRIDVRVSAK
jgi:outer membrane protein OmpA-like peptidoglycan-associated protein